MRRSLDSESSRCRNGAAPERADVALHNATEIEMAQPSRRRVAAATKELTVDLREELTRDFRRELTSLNQDGDGAGHPATL